MHVHATKGQWPESIYCRVMLFLILKDIIYTSMIFIWYNYFYACLNVLLDAPVCIICITYIFLIQLTKWLNKVITFLIY